MKITSVVLLLVGALSAWAADNKAARITARPAAPSGSCVPGLYPLGLASGRDGHLFIPTAAKTAKRLHLLVFLHGATFDSQEGLDALRDDAEREGFVLLAPDTRGRTWDAIRDNFGPDVEFLNRALGQVYLRCAVDAAHITIAGFSDGASYALSLGIANGDVFSKVIAFSPGFIIPAGANGKPLIFITHGTRDQILPIEQTSRRIVEGLQGSGYNVVYREWDGPHAMSRKLIEEALKWAR
jgi:phospholipase/carboxylesterase